MKIFNKKNLDESKLSLGIEEILLNKNGCRTLEKAVLSIIRLTESSLGTAVKK